MRQVISKINQKSLYIIYGAVIISISSLILVSGTFADNPANIDYSVTVEPALNITTSANKVSLDLNPLNHDFDSQDLTVSVSTNNETGYKLYVNTDSTKLVEKDDDNLYIETLSGEVSENNFTTNRWGYKLNSDNYLPFVSGTLINSSKTQIENSLSTLTFAAKVGYETKAGTYALALNFQATANPHIPYMQDYDKVTCATEATGTSTPVMDKRDGNEYRVRYINGNCWMVSSLNLAGGAKLYSETSNVPDGYPEVNNNPYYTLPASSSSGFSDETIAYVYNSGSSICANNVPCDSYYSYVAATAGTNPSSGSATSDICPKGWHLPTQSEYNAIANIYNTGLKLAAEPFLASFNGRYTDGVFYLGGANGEYRTSTAISSTRAYTLGYINSNTAPGMNDTAKRSGYNIRCIRSN